MTFDILDISSTELEQMTTVQMQLLRTAQKKKNELQFKMEQDLALFKKLTLTNGFKDSSLYEQKKVELTAQYDYDVGVLREQLEYSLTINEPFPGQFEDQSKVGYIVDYTLTYLDRYTIVKEYYLSITDPAERINLYRNDEVAQRYLGSYYTVLYNVLYQYSI